MRVASEGAGLTQYWRDIARDARAFIRERERDCVCATAREICA